jgi:hypothetical protein
MDKRKRTKGTKEQTMMYKTLHGKLKTEQNEHHLKSRVNSSAPEVLLVPAPLVTTVMLLLIDTNII